MESKRTLEPEVLAGIKPFSGTQDEMSPGEKLLREGHAVQKIHAQYTTAVAVQKPRSISRVTANVLDEAKLAGSSFYYGWTANKKGGGTEKIEGPSIDLAMCCARNYGNCAIDVDDEETLTHFKFRGVFIDLESGFTCPRLFRQRKNQNIGMKDTDRAEDITYQIGQSKVIRNCVVRAMPGWLIEKAIESAKEAELKGINPENIAFARAKVLTFFSQYGVTQERMEAKIGATLENWTPEMIVDLRGSATALKEGRITALELFPEATKGEKQEEKKSPKKTTGDKKNCPNLEGQPVSINACEKCSSREGCPAWETKTP